MKFEVHIPVTKSDEYIVDLISGATELSKQAIKQVMSKGAVWLTRDGKTDRSRRAKKLAQEGDEVHLYFDQKVLDEEPKDAILIADEKSYSLWHKPYGMRSQGSKWGDHCAIGRWIETHLEPERAVFPIHRLDRAASGLMVFAHSKKIASALASQFEKRTVDKKYMAVIDGKLGRELELSADIDNRKALSRVCPLEHSASSQQTLVAVKIETGRKHQIRKHLAGAGFPIIGDRLYNPNCKDSDPDLKLVSSFLEFDCPLTGERKAFELPEELRLRLNN